MTTKVTLVNYEEACDLYLGFCTVCRDFTTECVEPDAENYECEQCEENTVMGAEQALMEDLIEIEDGIFVSIE